jgi:putative transposase
MRTQVWPHAPTHQLSSSGTFMVTAATFKKEHHFRGTKRLDVLQRGLLEVTAKNGWHLEAWAMFSNHYHFVAHSPDGENAATLSSILSYFHQRMASWVNRLDAVPTRKVWHNFWETRLTYQASYFARLGYVHQNAAKHGLVACANQYPWCSASFFEKSSLPGVVKTIYGLNLDRVSVLDDFTPLID